MRDRSTLELLISLLSKGGRVQDDGYLYGMAEDGSLCIITSGDFPGEENFIGIECDLRSAKQLADSVGKDQLLLGLCALELYDLKVNK
jgi:hypothetical protein